VSKPLIQPSSERVQQTAVLLSLFSLDHSIPLGHPTAVFTNYCQKIRGYRKGGSYDSEIGEIKFSGVPEKYTCVLERGHCCEHGRYQFQILSVRGGGPLHRSSEYQAKAKIMTCRRVVGRLRYVIGKTVPIHVSLRRVPTVTITFLYEPSIHLFIRRRRLSIQFDSSETARGLTSHSGAPVLSDPNDAFHESSTLGTIRVN